MAQRLAESPLREAMIAFYEARWQAEEVSLHHTFNGHNQSITAVAFSPINTLLATADRLGQIILWDAATGQEVRRLPRQPATITALTFAQVCDSETAVCDLFLISGDETGGVSAWNVATAAVQYTLDRHTAAITAVTFQPDEQLLASADQSGRINFWEASTGSFRYGDTTSAVWDIAYTGQNVLAAATENSGIRLLRHGQGLTTLWNHGQPVRRVLFTPDGARLVSADATGRVWLWQVPADLLVSPGSAQFEFGELTALEPAALPALAFTSEGNLLTVATDAGVGLWLLSASEPQFWSLTDRSTQAVAFSLYGWLLALGLPDGTVQIWAAHT